MKIIFILVSVAAVTALLSQRFPLTLTSFNSVLPQLAMVAVNLIGVALLLRLHPMLPPSLRAVCTHCSVILAAVAALVILQLLPLPAVMSTTASALAGLAILISAVLIYRTLLRNTQWSPATFHASASDPETVSPIAEPPPANVAATPVFNAMPMGVMLFDAASSQADFLLHFANPAAHRLWPELVNGTLPLSQLPVEETLIARWVQVARHGGPPVTSHCYIQTGLVQGWFCLTGFQSAQGQLMLIFDDITGQEESKAWLQTQQRTIHRAINGSIAGVFVYDVTLRCHYFINERYTSITGYEHSEIARLSPRQLLKRVHPDDRHRFIRHLRAVLYPEAHDSQPAHIQYRFMHAQGHWIWLMAQDVVFAQDHLDNNVKFMGSFFDITPMRQLQDQLRQATTAAEKASQAKSDFLANMSHEIRTPMNAILALTEQLLTMELGTKQRAHMQQVNSASQSLLQILNDVLDYSKLEAGKLEPANEPFDLFTCVSDILHLFAPTASRQGLSIYCEVADTCPRYVVGDMARLRQILTNLVGNAIKFTEHGNIQVTLSADLAEHSPSQVSLLVRDTGIGIQPEHLDALFNEFTQADMTINRRFGGSGLGLAISRQLARLLGGDLKVRSTPGQGSCFTLTLPLAADPAQSEDSLVESFDLCVVPAPGDGACPRLPAEQLAAYCQRAGYQVQQHASQAHFALGNFENCDYAVVDVSHLVPDEMKQLLGNILAGPHVSRIRQGIVLISPLHSQADDILLNLPCKWLTTPILPSDVQLALVSLHPNSTPVAQAPQPARHTRCQALVVEDNVSNQYVATQLLEAMGFEVSLAEHGRQAIEQATQNDFDIVFMDLQMPVMDGYHAAEAIRQLPAYASVPIVAMSAAVSEPDKQRVIQAGMDAHVPKPVCRQRLQQVLATLLPNHAFPDAGPADIDKEALARWQHRLPDFAVTDALARLGGDTRLYQQLLQNFSRQYSALSDHYWQQQDPAGLAAQLHTLKGLAQSIGAGVLYRLCSQAEKSLPQTYWLAALSQQLAQVVTRVQHGLAQSENDTAQAAPLPSDSLQELIARLQARQYVGEQVLTRMQPLLTAEYGARIAEAICEAVVRLDYPGALALLAPAPPRTGSV